jgi:hypothetical protein
VSIEIHGLITGLLLFWESVSECSSISRQAIPSFAANAVHSACYCDLRIYLYCELGCREKSMPDVMGNLDKVLAGREFTLLTDVHSL